MHALRVRLERSCVWFHRMDHYRLSFSSRADCTDEYAGDRLVRAQTVLQSSQAHRRCCGQDVLVLRCAVLDTVLRRAVLGAAMAIKTLSVVRLWSGWWLAAVAWSANLLGGFTLVTW